MILGIVLCAIGQLSFAIYGWYLFFGGALNQEIIALLFGISIIGVILSIASIFLNYSRIKNGNKVHGIIGLVFTIVALLTFISYLITWYLAKVSAGGATFLTSNLLIML